MYAPETSPARLLVDGTASGAWNMAVDEVLLDSVARSGLTTLRFYRWSEPTLSLGYFQSHADRQLHPASRDCPLVRRQTGGGAILHDRELTYSLIVPLANSLAADPTWLYASVHEALCGVLAERGIATRRLAPAEELAAPQQPFLCFHRRAAGDVVFEQSKVCGSAQRRRRGAILQHGSLLLAASPCAPDLTGLAELTGQRLNADRLIETWGRAIAERTRLVLTPERPSERELADARTLTLEKYSAAAWNQRR